MAPYKTFLQNVTAILLQNVTEVYYKMSGFLLQNVTVSLQNVTVITKCDVCYKLQQHTHASCI